MWRSLATARLSADSPSGNAPTTRVRRRISRRMRFVGANPPPMLLWEGVVGERLLDRHFHQLGSGEGPRSFSITRMAYSRAAHTVGYCTTDAPRRGAKRLASPPQCPAPPGRGDS